MITDFPSIYSIYLYTPYFSQNHNRCEATHDGMSWEVAISGPTDDQMGLEQEEALKNLVQFTS